MASPFKGIRAPAVEIFTEKGTGRGGMEEKGIEGEGEWKVREEKGRAGRGGKERKCIIFATEPCRGPKVRAV